MRIEPGKGLVRFLSGLGHDFDFGHANASE